MSGSVVRRQLYQGYNFVNLRDECNQRLISLETVRVSWWRSWRELAQFILPRRYRWLVTPSQWNRGSQINQAILDPTATIALRDLAAGLMSGVTSPSRPWFRLGIDDDRLRGDPEVQVWLSDTTERLNRIMARSNYYVAKAVQYFDNVVFGTAPMLIYEDPEKVIHCFNPCAGEYCVANGPRLTVDTLYRRLTMTADQMVRKFGFENVSSTVQQAWRTRGAMLDQEFVIGHAIEPNPDFVADARAARTPGLTGVPRHFQFREIFWDMADAERPLRVTGFHERPFSCPRWDVSGNDAYGRSPGWDLLGLTKQLQLETKRKAEALDKMVKPPMMADVSMKNEPAALIPGSVTYVPSIQGGIGFKPVFQVIPPVKEIMLDIQDVRQTIRSIAFEELFKTISRLESVRTAEEIRARQAEQLVLLGPVLERNETEGLDPDVNRIYNIAVRRGLVAPPPQALRGNAGANVRVQYSSMLAEAQRAAATGALVQLAGFAGSFAALVPQAVDNLAVDDMVRRYADLLGVDPKLLNPPKKVGQIRQDRAAQQQGAAALQVGQAAATGAKTLSEADMSSANALTALTGGGV